MTLSSIVILSRRLEREARSTSCKQQFLQLSNLSLITTFQTQVISGLATSVVLFAMMMLILRASHQIRADELDSVGLLQAIWLLQRHPEAQRTITEVKVLTESNLRRAGMIDVSRLTAY